MSNMSMYDIDIRDTVKILIITILILIILDTIITLYALKLGLEESNIFTIILMDNFGDRAGLIIGMISKIILLTFIYVLYGIICHNMNKFRDRFILCDLINGIMLITLSLLLTFNLIIVLSNITIILSNITIILQELI